MPAEQTHWKMSKLELGLWCSLAQRDKNHETTISYVFCLFLLYLLNLGKSSSTLWISYDSWKSKCLQIWTLKHPADLKELVFIWVNALNRICISNDLDMLKMLQHTQEKRLWGDFYLVASKAKTDVHLTQSFTSWRGNQNKAAPNSSSPPTHNIPSEGIKSWNKSIDRHIENFPHGLNITKLQLSFIGGATFNKSHFALKPKEHCICEMEPCKGQIRLSTSTTISTTPLLTVYSHWHG